MHDHQVTRLARELFLQPDEPFHLLHQQWRTPCGYHCHEFYEIAFIVSGTGVHQLNGTTSQLVSGSMYLLTPSDFHQIAPHAGMTLELYNAIFAEHILTDDLYRLLFGERQQHIVTLPERDRQQVARLFHDLWDEAHMAATGTKEMIQSLLQQLCIIMLRHTPPQEAVPAPSAMHPAIRDALTYIHYHFRQPLSLTSVAQHVHLNATYFSECFHQEIGVTFQEHVRALRIQFALSLLTMTPLSITEIAASSGFSTLTHFERVFHQRYGMTPGSYRSAGIARRATQEKILPKK